MGPYAPDGSPDLRNLALSYTTCSEDDILVLCSDGVHDNLDPQSLGFEPKECGLPSWSGRDGHCDYKTMMGAKAKFTHEWLKKNLVPVAGNPTPEAIVNQLCQHSFDVTAKSRAQMESNSERKLSKNYAEFPGKMDHTTCLAFHPRFDF